MGGEKTYMVWFVFVGEERGEGRCVERQTCYKTSIFKMGRYECF
jgi:hypothetical protein